jgi:small subunit ribosomal protein S1
MEENQINNPNAEGQESAGSPNENDATTATTNAPAAETSPEVAEGIASQPVPETIAAHDDFDWTIDKRNVASYTQAEKEKYDSVYENTFVQLSDGELIKGLVVGITKTDVVLNIGFKSDGLVSLNEFRDIPGLMKWK